MKSIVILHQMSMRMYHQWLMRMVIKKKRLLQECQQNCKYKCVDNLRNLSHRKKKKGYLKNSNKKKIKMSATNTTARGITLRDTSANDFISAYSRFLKKSGRVDVPKWADIVKTGTHKQLAPLDPDWFFVRMAAVARRIYLRGGNGIGRLTKVYGGGKKRGSCPKKFVRGSGSVIRACIKQLEKLQVVEKDTKGGRKVTSIGTRDLDRIAGQILKKKTTAV